MLARGPQSPFGTLLMVSMKVGVVLFRGGEVCGWSGVGSAADCSTGGASAALMSVTGSSKGVLASIGVGFFGGRLVDFAIYFSPNTCIWRARLCFGVLGRSIP